MSAKKRKKKKPLAMAYELTTGKWSKVDEEKDVDKLFATVFDDVNDTLSKPQMVVPMRNIEDEQTKIVVVVPETILNGKIKMECGRMAAQVAHAVSKLKFSYVLQQDHADPDRSHDKEDALEQVVRMKFARVTTIVLKCRDENELRHIECIAIANNMHYATFWDTNPLVYGANVRANTAIAIGPLTSIMTAGLTDYLPLWKCACDPVR